MTPATNLALAAVVAIGLILLFRPRYGWFWRWTRGRGATERVQVEDALKHLHDCQYMGGCATVQSLAGTLDISSDAAARLSERLESLGLLASTESGLELTSEGTQNALRVIRIHRLWERYLADRTGVDQAEWHPQADLVEHKLTVAEADALAEKMGYPCFDPHGDPIPSAAGEIPDRKGQPLNVIQPGSWVRIVHVEDEPKAVYDQLLAAQLYPGMTVRVLESTPDRILLETDTQERILAPVVAANVAVEAVSEDPAAHLPKRLLSSLKVGDQATIADISPACRGLERRRLLDLGMVPGTVVQAELKSPGGDPTGYRIRGAVIAIRKEQADFIHIHS